MWCGNPAIESSYLLWSVFEIFVSESLFSFEFFSELSVMSLIHIFRIISQVPSFDQWILFFVNFEQSTAKVNWNKSWKNERLWVDFCLLVWLGEHYTRKKTRKGKIWDLTYLPSQWILPNNCCSPHTSGGSTRLSAARKKRSMSCFSVLQNTRKSRHWFQEGRLFLPEVRGSWDWSITMLKEQPSSMMFFHWHPPSQNDILETTKVDFTRTSCLVEVLTKQDWLVAQLSVFSCIQLKKRWWIRSLSFQYQEKVAMSGRISLNPATTTIIWVTPSMLQRPWSLCTFLSFRLFSFVLF